MKIIGEVGKIENAARDGDAAATDALEARIWNKMYGLRIIDAARAPAVESALRGNPRWAGLMESNRLDVAPVYEGIYAPQYYDGRFAVRYHYHERECGPSRNDRRNIRKFVNAVASE